MSGTSTTSATASLTTDVGAVAQVVTAGIGLVAKIQDELNTPAEQKAKASEMDEKTRAKLAADVAKEKTDEIQGDLSQ